MIVVIGILAAIVIVAYTGITQRSVIASMSSDLDNNAKAVKLYQVDNSGYPTSNDCSATPATNSICLKTSPGTIVTAFTQNNTTNPQTYCMSLTNESNTYYINQDGTPQSGGCTVTHCMTNPNFDTNIAGTNGPNGSTVARDTSRFFGGSASLVATMPAASIAAVGAGIYSANSVPGTLKPNTTHTVSAYVYVPSGTVDVSLSVQGPGVASKQNPSSSMTSVKDSWVRLNNIFVTSSSGVLNLYVLNKVANPTAGAQIWIDSTMLTEGSALLNYGDGNSPGWGWTSTVNGSASSGPQL